MKNQSFASMLDWEAIEKGKIAGCDYWIVRGKMWENRELKDARKRYPKGHEILNILERMSSKVGYNGYIRFKKKPVREKTYNGLMAYVPVHGGITLAHEERDGSIIYGFDTAHAGQENLLKEIRDPKWIKQEIKNMRAGILRVAKLEKKYLTAKQEKTKAKYAAQVFGMKRPANKLGFSAMINLLSGTV